MSRLGERGVEVGGRWAWGSGYPAGRAECGCPGQLGVQQVQKSSGGLRRPCWAVRGAEQYDSDLGVGGMLGEVGQDVGLGAGGIIDDEQTARGQQLRVVDAGVGFGDAGAGVGELVTDGSVGLLAGWAAPQNFAAGGGGSVVQAA